MKKEKKSEQRDKKKKWLISSMANVWLKIYIEGRILDYNYDFTLVYKWYIPINLISKVFVVEKEIWNLIFIYIKNQLAFWLGVKE